MALTDHKSEIIRLRKEGMRVVQIGRHFGVSPQKISALLISWGYRSKTMRRPTQEPRVGDAGDLSLFRPGEKYRLNGSNFRFLRITGGSRPLWLFQSTAGWKETFTESQLREASTA